MASANLSAKPRSGSGKSHTHKLRASGQIPAVVYGHGEQTRSVAVDAHELELLFSKVHVENTVINLNIDGEKGAVKALVREVQKHPARGNVVHVDFYQIHAGELVQVQVPIHFVGTPVGVRTGGMLQHTMDELDIRVSADNIPERIDVDVAELTIGDSIHVGDLTVPAGVEVLDPADRSVCSVIPPQAGIAEAAPEAAEVAAAPAEPEVIRRKKEEDEE
ncbi:MAG: 50S ribosomal protein L25/general stress protein Ctc [Gemmatimonadota bacterium]